MKRKRKAKGDLEVVEGDGAYEGPWARWDGDEPQSVLTSGIIPAGAADLPSSGESEDEGRAKRPAFVAPRLRLGAGLGYRECGGNERRCRCRMNIDVDGVLSVEGVEGG